QRAAAGQPACVDLRPGGPKILPGRHLYVDALLQREQGSEEGGGPPADGRVLPDGRPEDECGDGVYPAARDRRRNGAEGLGEYPVSPRACASSGSIGRRDRLASRGRPRPGTISPT